MSTIQELSEEIDRLLERYLHLLDQYTSLRTELSSQSSSMHINLSRANFSSQNNIRYDTTCYDDRMQALRLCHVTIPENAPVPTTNTQTQNTPPKTIFAIKDTTSLSDLSDKDGGSDENTKAVSKNKDPLKMFGMFLPHALRLSQGYSIKMVEEIIPTLINTEREMADVEIKIGRARKYRGKMEAKEKKILGRMENEEAVNTATSIEV